MVSEDKVGNRISFIKEFGFVTVLEVECNTENAVNWSFRNDSWDVDCLFPQFKHMKFPSFINGSGINSLHFWFSQIHESRPVNDSLSRGSHPVH